MATEIEEQLLREYALLVVNYTLKQPAVAEKLEVIDSEEEEDIPMIQ